MHSGMLLRLGRPLVLVFHLLLVPVAYYLAFVVRLDYPLPERYAEVFWSTLPWVLAIRLLTFGVFRLYRGWWRYAGVADLTALLKAVTLSSVLMLVVFFTKDRLRDFPRSIFFIDWALAILVFGGARLVVRIIREEPLLLGGYRDDAVPTLVVGAGDTSDRLIRELRRDRNSGIRPVAAVDDDVAKRHMHLHGVEVVGTVDDLPDLVQRYCAKLIIVALPSASAAEMVRIVKRCTESGVEFKTVPSLVELISHRAKVTELREVRIDDLLGRDAIDLDLGPVRQEIEGRVVMVTGGAGSIGSELARQVAALRPAKLVLVEQAESPLYYIDLDLREDHPGLEVVPIVADITDEGRMQDLFEAYAPDCVFHAAAYKHVPMMEHNVREAVRNNVFGTRGLAKLATTHGVKKFILISTDKAVKPSSVMGATKRIAERIMFGRASAGSETDFRAVRFGNVLGSDGSVVPLFKRQLAKGGPLTVTHPEVTRYFMTIPEACQLVLLAATLPEAAGRISMLEMGQPIRIVDLAENLIRLSGLMPGRDVKITYTGLRPGEKLHEVLLSDVEATVPTQIDKIRVVQTDEVNDGVVTTNLERLWASMFNGDDEMLRCIRALVPECVAPLRERGEASGRTRGIVDRADSDQPLFEADVAPSVG